MQNIQGRFAPKLASHGFVCHLLFEVPGYRNTVETAAAPHHRLPCSHGEVHWPTVSGERRSRRRTHGGGWLFLAVLEPQTSKVVDNHASVEASELEYEDLGPSGSTLVLFLGGRPLGCVHFLRVHQHEHVGCLHVTARKSHRNARQDQALGLRKANRQADSPDELPGHSRKTQNWQTLGVEVQRR